MKSLIVAFIVFCTASCDIAAHAVPMPRLDFKKLIESAGTICVGLVESVRDQGTGEIEYAGQKLLVERKLALVRVARTLKGPMKPGEHVSVEFVDSKQYLLPYAALRSGSTAMLFLGGIEEGNYQFADPYYGVQVAAEGPVDLDDASSPQAKIERELVAVVAESVPHKSLAALDRLFILNSPWLLHQSDALTATLKDNQVREALAGTVLALRIQNGSPEALNSVLELPLSITDRDSYLSWQHHLLTAVGEVHDEKLVPVLNKLLVSKSPAVRREASRALTTLANRSSMSYLVKGLQDADVDTSYNSLIALSRITGKPGPGKVEFERNREKYVLEWKTP